MTFTLLSLLEHKVDKVQGEKLLNKGRSKNAIPVILVTLLISVKTLPDLKQKDFIRGKVRVRQNREGAREVRRTIRPPVKRNGKKGLVGSILDHRAV